MNILAATFIVGFRCLHGSTTQIESSRRESLASKGAQASHVIGQGSTKSEQAIPVVRHQQAHERRVAVVPIAQALRFANIAKTVRETSRQLKANGSSSSPRLRNHHEADVQEPVRLKQRRRNETKTSNTGAKQTSTFGKMVTSMRRMAHSDNST